MALHRPVQTHGPNDRGPDASRTPRTESASEIPLWAKALKAVSVNARSLKRRVSSLRGEVEHLGRHPASFRPYLKALRPHQWLKNVLVFLPMLAAHKITFDLFALSGLAFVAFSFVASSVYVLNDLLDVSADRAHPRKRARPFASGAISLAHGAWMAPLLLMFGFVCAIPLGLNFVLVMAAYYAATTAYSLKLKRGLIIDICMLGGLYTMRIVAGGAATGIPLSVWLLAFCIFFFLSLAAVKRQAELVDGVSSGAVKAYGRGYHVDDLPLIAGMAISAGHVSVLVMALYVNSPAVLILYTTPFLLWGVCLVLLYWISRMVLVTHRGKMHDDPLVFAVKDRVSQICVILVFLFVVGGVII